MAALRTLSLPELVGGIIAYLDERDQGYPGQPSLSNIFACILVNKLWAREGIKVLWAEGMFFRTFDKMSQSRRQYYASKVQRLHIDGSRDYDLAHCIPFRFLPLDFPQLRILSLSHIEWDRRLFGAILHAQIQELHIDFADDSALQFIAERCPHLRHLKVALQSPVFSHTMFNFLSSFKSLRLLCLAFYPQIGDSLATGSVVIDEGTNIPIGSLRSLEISGFPDHMAALCNLAPAQLQNLRMSVDQDVAGFSKTTDVDLIRLAEVFRDLRSFRLSSSCLLDDDSGSTVSANDLMELAQSHKQLRELHLDWMRSFSGVHLTDMDIDPLASLLPNLTDLTLQLYQHSQEPRTMPALYLALGKHCRNLEALTINLEEDITTLDLDKPCLFPKLREMNLAVYDFEEGLPIPLGSRRRRGRRVKSVIAHHFPMLEKIKVVKSTDDGQSGYWNFYDVSKEYFAPWLDDTIDRLLCRHPCDEDTWLDDNGDLHEIGDDG